MLKVDSLKAGYQGMEILKEVSIEVSPGEIVALIGPNGAGKSTLLKSIFNLTEITGGKIKFKDKDITNLPTHDLISEGVSFVPQGRQVFSDMTVLENLEMGAYTFTDRELIKRNIKDVFDKFPILLEKKRQNASTLSGGQQQMLSIARALIQSPELLLMDEPSLGLSPLATKEIFQKIARINKEGMAILIVEQNVKLAVDIAHRTYVLESGKIDLEGGRDILQNPKVKEIYFGE